MGKWEKEEKIRRPKEEKDEGRILTHFSIPTWRMCAR